MSRTHSKAASAPAPPGFVVSDIKKLGSALSASLGRQLGLQHLRAHDFPTSRGKSMRIASPVPLYRDDGQQCPVLILRPADDAAGAFLEIALDYEFFTGNCALTHVSLKVHTGPSPRASALRFRAEWDPRVEARLHAQPHWNIDQIGSDGPPGRSASSTASVAPWVQEIEVAPWAPAVTAPPPPRVLDLRKIHFAMGSTWHQIHRGEDRRHSAPFEDEPSLVRWISGCAGYISAQLQHI